MAEFFNRIGSQLPLAASRTNDRFAKVSVVSFLGIPLSLTVNGISHYFIKVLFALKTLKTRRTVPTHADSYTRCGHLQVGTNTTRVCTV